MALPDQLEISAMRSSLGSPTGRNSLMVDELKGYLAGWEVRCAYRRGVH